MSLTYLAIFATAVSVHAQVWPTPEGADYETCTDKNSYFEPVLESAKDEASSSGCKFSSGSVANDFRDLNLLEDEFYVSPKCVYQSMATTMKLWNYKTCVLVTDKKKDITKAQPIVKNVAPCLSRKYHYFVYVKFLEAMRCLGINPAEIFPLINGESHFQANIFSSTGAVGFGQITPAAVNQITAKLGKEILDQRGEACDAFRDILSNQLKLTFENLCGWIMPHNGIARNFIYAGLAYISLKRFAANLVKSKVFKKFKPHEIARTNRDLAIILYNDGGGGVIPALKAAPVFTSYKGFRDYMRSALKEHYADNPVRLAEVPTYLDSIEGGLHFVEKNICKDSKNCPIECSNWYDHNSK